MARTGSGNGEEAQRTVPPAVTKFNVCISNVHGVLHSVESGHVVLSFDFDNYWFAEANITVRSEAEDKEPRWHFNNSRMRNLTNETTNRPTSTSPYLTANATPFQAIDHRSSGSELQMHEQQNLDDSNLCTPLSPTAWFKYVTDSGELHNKYMTVHLLKRKATGEQLHLGHGRISLDAIARGCERLMISITKDNDATPRQVGQVQCNVSMVNEQTIEVDVKNIRLTKYPSKYREDLKFICMDLCCQPFENGYEVQTEKLRDRVPHYETQLVLKRRRTCLRSMHVSSSSGGISLKLCLSIRRQMTEIRSEEIGMGALPIKLLFRKVVDGVMHKPSRFTVPFCESRGLVHGLIMLRNIPQFCQLLGVDLVNVNGVIVPADVDPTTRKLLPWLKLPVTMDKCPNQGDYENRDQH